MTTDNHNRHRIKLKAVSYKSKPGVNSGKKNLSSGLYKDNNKKLLFLPQITFLIVVLGILGMVGWYYWPTRRMDTTTVTKPEFALAPESTDTISYVPETNASVTNTPKNPAETFEITSTSGASCTLQRTATKPASISIADLTDQGWWIPAVGSDCSSNLVGIYVAQFTPAQFETIQAKADTRTTSLQLLDDKNTYALFFGSDRQPDYDGSKFLKPLTNGIISGTYYFDATKAYAQKRIGDSTYFLDGGCQAPRTSPCVLWKMDNLSGLVTMLKKDIALSAAGEAYEIKDTRFLKFSNTQDYKSGINLIFRAPDLDKIILLRVSTTSDSYSVTSTIDLIAGEDNYKRYI